jgi:MFS family permease
MSDKFGPVGLEPGVSRGHMWSLLYASFVTIGLVVSVAVMTPYFLTEALGLDEGAQGRALGTLNLVNELTLILIYGPLGALSDRFGRRAVYVAGFLALATGYMLYPHATSLAELSVYRIVCAIGVGAATGMLATVIADYAVEPDRGKLVAIVGILNGLGVVIAALFVGKLPAVFAGMGYSVHMAGVATMAVVAAVTLLSAAVLAAGLKPHDGSRTAKQPLRQSLATGFRAGVQDREIALAYASAFVARGDLAIIGLFTIAWGKQAAIAQGMTTADAIAAGSVPFVVAQSAALMWPLVLIFVLDRIDRVKALALCMGLGAAGYVATIFITDPLGTAALPLFCLLGIGQISAFLGAQSLINKAAPAADRGAIVGTYNFAGAVGILILGTAGGWLFDHMGPASPFVLVGLCNAAVAVAAGVFRR